MRKIILFVLIASLYTYSHPYHRLGKTIHIKKMLPFYTKTITGNTPEGLTPAEIKAAYHIPTTTSTGTIAIITAYASPSLEKDVADFSKHFNLPPCSREQHCLEIHTMEKQMKESPIWELETTLDVEWAHAIAPTAHILVVESPSSDGADLLAAVDYAANRSDVRAISMSWGGAEFPEESSLDVHFTSPYGALFFASSGNHGNGVNWPASSANVIAVGGTSLSVSDGEILHEIAWNKSGGGLSAFEKAPLWQHTPMRTIPDVAYNADPAHGFPIIHNGLWSTVGGTSAGTPQWAALSTLYPYFTASKLYSLNSENFHDIISGSNGSCGAVCTAHTGYDHVTGLGSPQSLSF